MPTSRRRHRRPTIDSRRAGLRNERLVMALLAQHGELSQTQLCQLAGISSSTASYIVGRLRDKRLIRERAGPSTRRGAKPVLISLYPHAQLAVGVAVSPAEVHVGLFDAAGELLETLRAVLTPAHTPDEVANAIEITVRGLLAKRGVPEDGVVGIGVTVSGAISADGVVQLSSPMGWTDVPLRDLLQQRFATAVHVYSTRVRVFSELRYGQPTATRQLVWLNFADGVGATVAAQGQLLLGATHRAGELGHIIFEPDGPLCGCGHRGCLEALVSGPAVAARIRRDLAAGRPSRLGERVRPTDTPREVLDHLAAAIADGDAYALELRAVLADHIGRASAIAINCYDPDVVVLAGYVIGLSPDHFIAAAHARIATDVFDHQARQIEFRTAGATEHALIHGAATAILQRALTHF
jgi:N-acetylglucosamine repressor